MSEKQNTKEMPKSVKLTQAIRESICSNIVKQWETSGQFPIQEMEEAEHALAVWVWEQRHKKYKDMLQQLPAEYFSVVKELRIVSDGCYYTLKLPKEYPHTRSYSYSTPWLDVPKNNKLLKMWLQLKEGHDLWKTERYNLRREVKTILDSVSTTKQLLEVWPNVLPLIPANIVYPNSSIKLPAIPIEGLNKKLGI